MDSMIPPDDETAVRTLVQDYFIGLYEGDVDRLRRAFDPQAQVIGTVRGVPLRLDREAWLQRLSSQPSPSAQGERFDMSLRTLLITGDVGLAAVRDLYRGLWFTDHLSVARLEGRWQIVCKLFHHDPA